MKFTAKSYQTILDALSAYSVAIHNDEEYNFTETEQEELQNEITKAENEVVAIGKK